MGGFLKNYLQIRQLKQTQIRYLACSKYSSNMHKVSNQARKAFFMTSFASYLDMQPS